MQKPTQQMLQCKLVHNGGVYCADPVKSLRVMENTDTMDGVRIAQQHNTE